MWEERGETKAQQPGPEANQKCDPHVIGILMVTCDDDGNRKETWVDLKKVHALSWCSNKVNEKPAHKHGNNKFPVGKKPGDCSPRRQVMRPGEPEDDEGEELCWWDGRQWVCGEEIDI